MNSLALQHKEITARVFEHRVKPIDEFRHDLQQLENVLLDLPGVTLRDDPVTPLSHFFTPDLYARKIEIPAAYVLVTGIHATEHIAVISKGSCLVATPDGVIKYQAGDTIITKVGTKRAMLVLEDLIWTTIHAISASTPEEAIEMIEFKPLEDVPCQYG